MRTGDRLGQLIEQGLLNLSKLARVHHFEDIFDLIEIHDFLGAIGLRPEAQQSEDNLDSGECLAVKEDI